MTHNDLLRQYRPESYAEHHRRELLLHKPMSFAERFDGVLFQLGRWSYEQVAEEFDILATRQLDRYAKGGTEDQWEADRSRVALMFECSGWTHDEFDEELVRRLAAKFEEVRT